MLRFNWYDHQLLKRLGVSLNTKEMTIFSYTVKKEPLLTPSMFFYWLKVKREQDWLASASWYEIWGPGPAFEYKKMIWIFKAFKAVTYWYDMKCVVQGLNLNMRTIIWIWESHLNMRKIIWIFKAIKAGTYWYDMKCVVQGLN